MLCGSARRLLRRLIASVVIAVSLSLAVSLTLAGPVAAAAPPSKAALSKYKCSTLLPDSLLASYLPEILGRPTKLRLGSILMQSWVKNKRTTIKSPSGSGSYTASIAWRFSSPGASECNWGSEGFVEFKIWYAPQASRLENAYGKPPNAEGPYAKEAWALFSAGSGLARAQSGAEDWCNGTTPVDAGLDARDCAMHAVSGIGQRAAEGLGYIVFQEKGNTYVIQGKPNLLCAESTPNTCTPDTEAPLLSYAQLEALAHKIVAEAAALPPPPITVQCLSGSKSQCGTPPPPH